MSDIWADVKPAIRMFRRNPGFTATAVAAVALGIAATTAIFSIVDAALLRPLPVRDPDRSRVGTGTAHPSVSVRRRAARSAGVYHCSGCAGASRLRRGVVARESCCQS